MFGKLKDFFKGVHINKEVKKESRGVKKYVPTSSDFERLIYKWNIDYPIDRWYRSKYNLRFNSPEHRDSCLIDMALEYTEERLFEYRENNYEPGKGDFLKEQKVELPSDDKLMEVFSSQDLSYLDDKQ